MKYCKNCGKKYSDEMRFCQSCGSEVVPAEERTEREGKVCPKCKRSYGPKENFCKVCGSGLEYRGAIREEIQEESRQKSGILMAVIVAIAVFTAAAAVGFFLFGGKNDKNAESDELIAQNEQEVSDMPEEVRDEDIAEEAAAAEEAAEAEESVPEASASPQQVAQEQDVQVSQPQESAAVALPPEESQVIASVVEAGHNFYTSTSALAEYGMEHSADRAFDGDITTAWVEGVSGNGVGEAISVAFDGTYWVNGFRIYAGYHKSEDLYYKNSRPSEITLSFSDGTVQSFTLRDVYAPQDITLFYPVTTTDVTITVSWAYSGHKYEDTVISEISFY